jgi:hypothetical protein
MTPEPRRSSRRRSRAIVLAAGLSTGLCSCGGASSGPLTLHPAGGQVLFQGKPLPGVQVLFRPTGLDKDAPATVPMGRTDDEGKFRLASFVPGESRPSDGAPAGDYLVAISTPARSDSIDFTRKEAAKTGPDLLQRRFADPRTSGLKATIRPGPNALEPFDLK